MQDGSGDEAKTTAAEQETDSKSVVAAAATNSETKATGGSEQAASLDHGHADEFGEEELSTHETPIKIVMDGQAAKPDQQGQQDAAGSSGLHTQQPDLQGYTAFVHEDGSSDAELPLKFAGLDVDDAESRSTTLGGSPPSLVSSSRNNRQALEGQQASKNAADAAEAVNAAVTGVHQAPLSGNEISSTIRQQDPAQHQPALDSVVQPSVGQESDAAAERHGVLLSGIEAVDGGQETAQSTQLASSGSEQLQRLADQQASMEQQQQRVAQDSAGSQDASLEQRPETGSQATLEPQATQEGNSVQGQDVAEQDQEEDPSWT